MMPCKMKLGRRLIRTQTWPKIFLLAILMVVSVTGLLKLLLAQSDVRITVANTTVIALNNKAHHSVANTTVIALNNKAHHSVLTVAIGGGITSNRIDDVGVDNLAEKFQFFATLLPTFCQTIVTPDWATSAFIYQFYLAYDDNDPVFTKRSFNEKFVSVFREMVHRLCPNDILVDLHLVQCSHHGRPAWAQNDAMMEAYLDGADYFYRINDDTVFVSPYWTDVFVYYVLNYNPSNVGVVGPTHDTGNLAILTYDFVHRTHIDLFGFYYPRAFTDWYADDWITAVYAPEHVIKVNGIKVEHQTRLGRRYFYDATKRHILYSQVHYSRRILARYIYAKRHATSSTEANGSRVIVMSLYGSNPNITWGAVRNAQLIRVFFPGWKLRVYIPPVAGQLNIERPSSKFVSLLRYLGADIFPVSDTLNPEWWSYLAADDADVEYFLVRRPDARICDRDAAAVSDWISYRIQAGRNDDMHTAAVHCLRDHVSHLSRPITDGLWAAHSRSFRQLMNNRSMSSLIADFLKNKLPANFTADSRSVFLSEVIWPLVKNYSILCHDIDLHSRWPNSRQFPVPRDSIFDHVGLKRDQYDQIVLQDGFLDEAQFEQLNSDRRQKLTFLL